MSALVNPTLLSMQLSLFCETLESIDNRAMHVDGPVPPTLKIATDEELATLYASAIAIRENFAALLGLLHPAVLCEDCPPANYPTDKTRCAPCPRRPATPATADAKTKVQLVPDTGREVLAWWPHRELDDEDMPTGKIVGGSWVVAFYQSDAWHCPAIDDEPGAIVWGDSYERALEPECWQELPPAPDAFLFGAGV